jgi:molecular chaperone GrpE (heat shock protein)
MEALQHEFREKIKRDTCKEKIIDNLHQELQQYRDNFIKSNLKSIIMDIIKIVDDIRKLVDYHRSEEPSQHDIPKLISHLEGISADLEDICLWHGVESFNSEKGQFNPVRQKILKQIETSQAEKDKCVAEQLRPGYLWEGRVLRPEMVSVYVYREAAPDSIDFEKRTSDEQAD